MTIPERIQKELTESRKARELLKIDVLRGMKTALKLKEVEKIRALSDIEVLQVIQSLLKQRKESIEQFTLGGRNDLVAREQAEVRILEDYLPAPVSENELKTVILQVISELQASTAKDIGRVMKTVMSRFAGKNVDGKTVNEMVRAQLGS
jgi:uncharacterized protein YqeY